MRENCEDSSKLWQPMTNDDVRVNVRALTCGPTDSVNKCEPNVRDKQENIFAVVDLLKKALRNYAKMEYHSIVNDVPDLVNIFNALNPEYEQRLGYNIVLEEAERLHLRGWK